MTHTNALPSTLDAELIVVQSDVSSRKKLLQDMAHLLAQPLSQVTKEKDVYHLLLEREKLGNTGVGNGVAIPHSRCEQAHKAVVAIITLEEAIDYDSIDRQAVDIAFGLLVPTEATQEHLNLLAEIAKMMSNNDNKAQLSSAKTPAQVIDLITEWSSS